MTLYKIGIFIHSVTNGSESSFGEIDGINYWFDPNYLTFKRVPKSYRGRVLEIINKLNLI